MEKSNKFILLPLLLLLLMVFSINVFADYETDEPVDALLERGSQYFVTTISNSQPVLLIETDAPLLGDSITIFNYDASAGSVQVFARRADGTEIARTSLIGSGQTGTLNIPLLTGEFNLYATSTTYGTYVIQVTGYSFEDAGYDVYALYLTDDAQHYIGAYTVARYDVLAIANSPNSAGPVNVVGRGGGSIASIASPLNAGASTAYIVPFDANPLSIFIQRAQPIDGLYIISISQN